jgi:hypothetical protein
MPLIRPPTIKITGTNAAPVPSPTALPPSVPRNETTRTVLQRLFRQVSDSSDALFFVFYTTDPAVPPVWRLGQVDNDDSSPSVAKQSGIYRVGECLATDPTLRWLANDFPLAECLIVGPLDLY